MKLLVSDVDNTLITRERGFSKELVQAIKKIHAQGDMFVLCSGRPSSMLYETALKFNKEGADVKYISGYNGVQIVDVVTKQILHDYSLTSEQVKEITDVLLACDLEFGIYGEKKLYSVDPNNEHALYESSSNDLQNLTFEQAISSPKVIVYTDPKDNQNILKKLIPLLPDYTVVDSAPIFIEITNKNISKATALSFLCDYLNVPITNTWGFGDSGNDLELIKMAHTGVAVSNAKTEIIENAQIVIDSVENDGVRKYLNDVIVINKYISLT